MKRAAILAQNGRTDQQVSLKPAGFRQSVFSLLLATLVINILSLALPVMTLQVYDRILPNPGTGTLPVLMTGVCVAIVLESLLRFARSYVIGRAGAKYEHCMACEAMAKVLGADLSQMESNRIGKYMNHIGAIGKLKEFYNGYSLTVVAELAFVPVFLLLVFYISRELVIVPTAVMAVFVLLSFFRGRRLKHFLGNREQADEERYNFLIESLMGVHTLKAFSLENFFVRRYERLEEDSSYENYKVAQETADMFNIGAIFSHLMVACVISAGAWLVLSGSLTTGGLIAVLLLSGRMMQPVQRALVLWARYQDSRLARKHLSALITMSQDSQKRLSQKGSGNRDHIAGGNVAGRLTLDSVSFCYGNGDGPALDNINLDLQPGEAALISGTYGTGKTTLLKLIAGIYPPGRGRIEIDGRNIRDYTAEELVCHVGYIRTNPLIFRGTIRDNITCFDQVSEKQAQEVSAMLGVSREVAKLPGGFDTFLNGNNTDVIPPGLKQRLAMVRVLAQKPRLILFDNADRALDREGYITVYSLLARLKEQVSLLLVTDDENLRALADYQYVLTDGILQMSPRSGVQDGGAANIRLYRGDL